MPRDVVALVSADDFVSAVRVYSDRVNDLLRRGGVPALEAIEICETHALALLDAVVNAPESVIDLAGWWFARAIEVTSGAAASPAPAAIDEPISMLAGTAGEEQVRAALAGLPEAERAAVILRDGYDLPNQAVGVALRRGEESAAELTAVGRLNLVAAYDDRRAPDLSGHSGRTTVDLVALSRLADGTLESPRGAPLRRHVGNCPACEEVLESLAKGRRLAAGLPIIAMDDDARESLIDRVATRAEAVLPSHDAVLRAVDEDHDPGPVVSPVIAIVALVLALSLGIAIAVVSRQAELASGAATGTEQHRAAHRDAVIPGGSAGHAASPDELRRQRRPPQPATGAPPSPATRRRPRHRRPRHRRAGPTRISLSPTSGRSGTTITVFGPGFPPADRGSAELRQRPLVGDRPGRCQRQLHRAPAGQLAGAGRPAR